jgi:hypothetical protein
MVQTSVGQEGVSLKHECMLEKEFAKPPSGREFVVTRPKVVKTCGAVTI